MYILDLSLAKYYVNYIEWWVTISALSVWRTNRSLIEWQEGKHKTELKDLKGEDDHNHQKGDLNQQHKELGDDLGEDQLGHVDPCHPRPVNETFFPFDHQGQRSETDRDPKRHTENTIMWKQSNSKLEYHHSTITSMHACACMYMYNCN